MATFQTSLGAADTEAYIQELHSEGPVRREGPKFWVVSGYEAAQQVLRNHEHYSSAVTADGYLMLTDDPPKHTRFRKVVQRAFTPAAISGWRPTVESVAADLVRTVPPRQVFDAVVSLAMPLPIRVIGSLVGIPESRASQFKHLADLLTDQAGSVSLGTKQLARQRIEQFLRSAIAETHQTPGAEFMCFATAQNGTRVTEDEMVGLATLLVIAGYETTSKLIANVLFHAAQRPAVWERACEPENVENLIEEVLRFDPPVQFVARKVVTDTILAGRELSRGDDVVVYLTAANRDPIQWSHPHRFDPDRRRRRPLSFGYGIHTCLGAALARLEAATLIQSLRCRFSALALAPDVHPKRSTGLLSGFLQLPIRCSCAPKG